MGDLVQPFVVDEVQNADKKTSFYVKLMWSVIAYLILRLCNELSLYGIHSTVWADPFPWMSVIFTVSSRRNIMYLVLASSVAFPLAMSMLVMELLLWFNILQLDKDVEEDRALWNYAQKVLGILITIGMAVACVLCGMYGSVDELGVGNAILKVVQQCFGGIIVIFLVEFEKRYDIF
ncbi:protein transport protein Sec61 subunit alpha [Spinacia oleracea]|uniref:Protein transport protein Sec61 subunit alpha n=1 Tax=Spinacia oleracea TaxID=3562 RepID=A0A9R0JMN5_SPIOL|nr:protein transport protein Sec61 subunit alpha-like [Spinacia oleracea]